VAASSGGKNPSKENEKSEGPENAKETLDEVQE